MKVIWISSECPYPANTGGRIVVMKKLEYFSQNNEIYFFCVVDDDDEYKYRIDLLKIQQKTYSVTEKLHFLVKIQVNYHKVARKKEGKNPNPDQ